MPHLEPLSPRSRNSNPNGLAPRPSRTQKSSTYWSFSTGWVCCALTAVGVRAASSKSIFFADPRHALRSFAPVLFRSIAVFRKPLLILFRQAGKFLPYKRKELLRRRRHQEQHAGEKPLRSRLLRRRRYGF